MKKPKKEKRVLQWHPAFYAGLIIELGEEEKKVYFENEYQLGTKPKEIDVLVIKKNRDEPIEKNIGRIFRNKDNNLYSSVMNIIMRANESVFKEESGMCEAIIELFQEEYDAGISAALQRGMEQGMQQGIERGVQQGKLQQLMDLVRDNLLSMDEAVKRAGISREEFAKRL